MFYVVVYALGASLDDARRDGWLFPASNVSLPFWRSWEVMYVGMADGDVKWAGLAT